MGPRWVGCWVVQVNVLWALPYRKPCRTGLANMVSFRCCWTPTPIYPGCRKRMPACALSSFSESFYSYGGVLNVDWAGPTFGELTSTGHHTASQERFLLTRVLSAVWRQLEAKQKEPLGILSCNVEFEGERERGMWEYFMKTRTFGMWLLLSTTRHIRNTRCGFTTSKGKRHGNNPTLWAMVFFPFSFFLFFKKGRGFSQPETNQVGAILHP